MSATLSLQEQRSERARHFIVGQDRDGHWVAIETHGLGGGVFRSRKDALDYAVEETLRRADAVTISEEPIAFRL